MQRRGRRSRGSATIGGISARPIEPLPFSWESEGRICRLVINTGYIASNAAPQRGSGLMPPGRCSYEEGGIGGGMWVNAASQRRARLRQSEPVAAHADVPRNRLRGPRLQLATTARSRRWKCPWTDRPACGFLCPGPGEPGRENSAWIRASQRRGQGWREAPIRSRSLPSSRRRNKAMDCRRLIPRR